MGRPPSNGGPSFRFNQSEIAEMEAILQAHKVAMPAREVLVSLAEKFSNSEERSGKIEVHMKQVWNWFQNRRYAIRAKAAKSPGKLNITQMTRDDSTMVKGVPQATQPHAASSATVRTMPQAPQHPTVPSAAVRTFPQAPQHPAAFSVQSAGRVADNSQMEYEAKSARDGAWYDVSTFLSHRSLETGDPEVLVRFAGFGAEEDEWVNVRKNVRQRSLPCESSECVAVLPADLILCFQEGKEQALYFDAHVLDAQRRRHDVRGCRCRFLVRYDHDQSEEIVALRKICRRPETDYRLQQLHAVNESLSANQNKNGANNIHTVSTLRVYPPAEVQPKQLKVEPVVPPAPAEVPQKRPRVDSTVPAPLPEVSQSQFKVEPMVLAPAVVPQNQQRVQPAPPPEVPHLHKVETQPPQKVEPVGTFPSSQASLEPKKVEVMVPLSSPQEAAAKAHNVEAVVPTHSDEVPPKSHVPTEVSVEPHKVEADASSGIAKQEMQAIEATVDVVMAETSKDDDEYECAGSGEVPQSVVVPLTKEHQKAEAAPSGEVSQAVVPSAEVSPTVVEALPEPHKGEPEAQRESMVSGSSGEVPAELHEVQPAVPDTSAPEAIETKPEESVVLISTKAEEAVVPVAETEQPEVSEIMENKQDAETGKENKVEEGAATVDMEEG